MQSIAIWLLLTFPRQIILHLEGPPADWQNEIPTCSEGSEIWQTEWPPDPKKIKERITWEIKPKIAWKESKFPQKPIKQSWSLRWVAQVAPLGFGHPGRVLPSAKGILQRDWCVAFMDSLFTKRLNLSWGPQLNIECFVDRWQKDI